MAASRSLYRIVFFGPTGQRETVEIAATKVRSLEGMEDSIVCFDGPRGTMFAILFKNLIHATRITAESVTKPAPKSSLRSVR